MARQKLHPDQPEASLAFPSHCLRFLAFHHCSAFPSRCLRSLAFHRCSARSLARRALHHCLASHTSHSHPALAPLPPLACPVYQHRRHRRPSATPLTQMISCMDYLTNITVVTPPSICCDGLKSVITNAPICLCHGMNGDMRQLFPSHIDPIRMLILPLRCGTMLPIRTLFSCNSKYLHLLV